MTNPTSHDRLYARVRQTFLDHGFDQLTMSGLARACDLTRRALYNHFSGKEHAFREMLSWQARREIDAGLEAGRQSLAAGHGALEAIVAILDVRYGDAGRDLSRSPHRQALAAEAMTRGGDIVVEAAGAFETELGRFIEDLERQGLLRLRADVTPRQVARLLADGARGVGQAVPAPSADSLLARYRDMSAAILYGCADLAHDRRAVRRAAG